MRKDPRSTGTPRLGGVSGTAAWLLVLLIGMAGCKKKSSPPRPWARALPVTTARYPLPKAADVAVGLSRRQLQLDGKPLCPLKDGRLPRTQLRDGIDGLFVPKLHQALQARRAARAASTRIAIHAQPAVPFRTLRAVLYTAMRAGFLRPWLVADGAGEHRTAIPLDLPGTPPGKGHGLRSSPPRTPAIAIGLQSGAGSRHALGAPGLPGRDSKRRQGVFCRGKFLYPSGAHEPDEAPVRDLSAHRARRP